MKKFGLLFFVFVFIITNCRAISRDLQYKKEIDAVIKKQIPYSKKQIKSIIKEIKSEENIYVKRVLIEQGINSVMLEFYIKLAGVTNKYFDINKDMPNTDYYADIKSVINPYLENNGADVLKIDTFLKYADKQQKLIEEKYNN